MSKQKTEICRATPSEAETFRREDETLEPLLLGKGYILQKRQGYRFSLDALLLASLVTQRQKRPRTPGGLRCVDLGTGCGIVPVLLSKWDPSLTGYAVEIQESLASLAERNIRLHGIEGRFKVLCTDLKVLPDRFPKGAFDLVTVNPPYRQLTKGNLNPNPEKALARHELAASLPDICEVMGHLLRQKGRAYTIYPAGRLTALMARLQASGLEPRYVQPVCPRPGERAIWVLVEAVCRGREELWLDEPLYVHDAKGEYTEKVARIFDWTFG